MSHLQTHYHFKLDFQKVDQHIGGKWLIHGTKHRKDNGSKSWNSPVEPPEYTHGKHPIDHPRGCVVCILEV